MLRIELKGPARLASAAVRGRETRVYQASTAAGETWLLQAEVTLAEGDNAIRMEATDEHGTKAEIVVTLTRRSLVILALEGPAGAQVKVGSSGHALDAQGRLTLSLPPGQHHIEATREGFIPARQTVTLAPGQGKVSQRLAMAQVVPPTITVLDPKPGTPIRSEERRVGKECRL